VVNSFLFPIAQGAFIRMAHAMPVDLMSSIFSVPQAKGKNGI
jgi:hypothetical protein